MTSANTCQPGLVSIIMNCLNCERYLRQAIDSVYAQTYPLWEIIFWDNASTDHSGRIVKDYDQRLRCFRGSKTVPLGHARNLALKQARGEFIAFLDCDDMWLPEKLERQVAVFKAREDVGFVYGNYFRLIENQKRYLGFAKPQPQGDVFRSALTYYPVPLQTVMVRHTVLQSFEGPFDETLTLSEDYDLFLRILYHCKAAYIHEPLVVYRVHENMSSMRLISEYPKEIEYVISKLKSQIDGFQQEFEQELQFLEAKLGYWKARAEMTVGSRKKARDHLNKYKFVNARFCLLFLLTFFPRGVWSWVHGLKKRNIFS
jgi:glycosyltransferase involved in cell wall biosynthesis